MIVPHSPEIERAVIGEMLLEPDLLRKAGLKQEDFYGGAFRCIFRAMEELFHKTKFFDLPLLAENLGQEDLDLLHTVASEAFTVGNFSLHTAHLRELSAKRKLQRLCVEVADKIDERGIEEGLLKIRVGLSEILTGQGGKSVTGVEMAAEGWKRIEDRARRRGKLSGIPCGLRPLDDHLDGFQECELSIIAARPGVGKTAFALHALLSAAQAGQSGAFLSIEMGKGQITDRLHSTLSGVPLRRIRKGLLGPEDWEKITAASTILNGLPIRFSFDCRNLKDVISLMISNVENHGAKIVFLDYLQLIKTEGAQNREREISMISGELKALAKSLKVPVIAVSQLSRALEKREGRQPILADLRDSGSLEQDADNVILLYRPDINELKGPIDFIVAKGRNTGGGTFKAHFDGEKQRFFEEPRDGAIGQ